MNNALTVSEFIHMEARKGRRAADIAKELAGHFPRTSKAQINTFVRTEVSKMQTARIRACV